MTLGLLLSFAGVATQGPVAQADPTVENQRCLHCHAMATVAVRGKETGAIKDLLVSPIHLAASVHGRVACTRCHGRSFRSYPHRQRLEQGALDCVGCHRGDPRDATLQFADIDAEFRLSAHARASAPEAAGFSCHSCHDPHRFRVAQVGDGVEHIVQSHNQVCLSCHQGLGNGTSGSHAWLPNRELHYGAVRCIDCHTQPGALHSHTILAAADSARHCTGCHSADAHLRQHLYDYRSVEELERRGWLAKALYNEAYLVGMSRNPDLDRLALSGLYLVALLLFAHGLGRYLTHRVRGGQG